MELNQETTSWSATSINRRSLIPKPRYKTTNWKQYNKALINRGSLTFWVDEETIAEWKKNKQGKRGRPRRLSDLAIYYRTDAETRFLYAIESAARFSRLSV